METIPEDSKCKVMTKDGPICGYIQNTEDGTFFRFKSIPYAIPPLGQYRFMPPFRIKPWTELKDCTQDAPLPIQLDYRHEIFGSEDSLYIEVSTPSIEPNKPMPIMFWTGGCTFSFFLDHYFDSSPLTANDVVFVRCGFRLGPFGFFSINQFNAPGNCGLKDIVMALVWVQNNISAFGGDPTNVTIFGSSVGGAIVHLMMKSPMATGLFHKAIIQGASAVNNWTIHKNPVSPVLELANYLGIEATCKLVIVEALKQTPLQEIMAAFLAMSKQMKDGKLESLLDAPFKPCIEEEFEGQPAFLTRNPIKILKSGNFNKVPLIIGSNNIEAAFLPFTKHEYYEDYEKYNKNLELLVPKALTGEANVCKIIAKQLLTFYFGEGEQLREDTKSQYLQMFTDYNFLYYVNKTVRLLSQYLPDYPIYYYVLNYVGSWSMPDYFSYSESMGHSAEVFFIFRMMFPELKKCIGSRDSLTTRDRVVKMWTNFAKCGNPTPDARDPLLQIKWDPVVDEDRLNYLSIGAELTKGTNPFRQRMAFWDDLHKEHVFLRATLIFNDLGISW